MRSLILFLAFLLWGARGFAAITQSEAKELQAVAKAYGLPAVITDAASTYVDTGDVAPLRRLLLREELPVAVGAAGFLLELGEPFAPDVVARLKRREGSAEAQLACLAFATDRATVQYLVERLATEQDPKLQRTLRTSLRVVTGKDLTTADEWNGWWRKQPRRYRPKGRSMEEIMGKIAMANSATLRDSLQSVAKVSGGKKDEAAMNKLADFVSSISEMQEEGRKLRLSRLAREGDDRFRRGDFAAAEGSYRRAVARQPKDHRSAFLQACALVELGKLAEARAIFTRLHGEDERRKAAAFMAELCAREMEAPGMLAEHAIEIRKALGKPEDLITWGDPTLRVILSQRSAMVPGPEYLDLEQLSARFAEEEDPLMLLGLALCHPPALQGQLLKVLVERFPAHPAILSQYLRRTLSWRTADRRKAELPAIRAWVAAEPDNALPRLLEIAVELEPSIVPPDQAPQIAAETLARVEEALRLPRYETHVTAVARAQLAALRSTDSASLARVSVAGSQGGILHLWQSLMVAASGMSARREHDSLDRVSDILAGIARHETTTGRSSFDRVVTLMFQKNCRALQLKDLRTHRADDPRLLEWEAESEKLQAIAADPFAQTADVFLEILPVPSLQRALTRRTYQFSLE